MLLNDTRHEDHVGCRLVVKNILHHCSRVGLDVVATDLQADARTNAADFVRQRGADFQLLLINGEGTMHHDKPRALALGEAAIAAARLGKRVVIFNTVWQENHRLNDCLSSVDLVFCRESFSQAHLASASCQATVVPDLVFATPEPAMCHRRSGTVVLDSVHAEIALQWAWRALRYGYALMPMSRPVYRSLRRRFLLAKAVEIRSGRRIVSPGEDFLGMLAKFERVISGRFHGVCLAFLLGIPVVGIRSNTHKTEGLFHDAGLDERALIVRGDRTELQHAFAYVDRQMPAIRSYVESARLKIADMFQRIRALAFASHAA